MTGEQGRWMAVAGGLDARTCDELTSICRACPEAAPAVVGGDELPEHRVGTMRRVERADGTAMLYDLLAEVGRLANDRYFRLDLSGIVKAPEYVEYPAGRGVFHWHNDYGLERPESRRKLTLSVQLSEPEEYEGGDFEVFGVGRPLPRQRGTLIALPAYVHHRVTPVRRGVRRALVAWLAGPALR
jgi:predicted 2-oxoglutarate/Fe(II)-dependent dioxygenase YbiX